MGQLRDLNLAKDKVLPEEPINVFQEYPSDFLFLSGINPKLKANKISKLRYRKLIRSIETILSKAIDKGGTTLRDFVNGNGMPGYFSNELKIYNRAGESCIKCKRKIKMIRQNQRSTFYCAFCQT